MKKEVPMTITDKNGNEFYVIPAAEYQLSIPPFFRQVYFNLNQRLLRGAEPSRRAQAQRSERGLL